MMITLSPRLACIARYVEQGSRVVDVGTDHAYLPIWLLQSGVSPAAFASDVRQGPLRNAERDAEKYGVRDRLTLLLCDGLALCPPEDVDTVVLAGMGGETMMGILDAAPWALEKRLILQPQTKKPEFREWLFRRGLYVSDASLVYDTGRIYLVWKIGAGAEAPCGPIDRALIEKALERMRADLNELERIHREASQWQR